MVHSIISKVLLRIYQNSAFQHKEVGRILGTFSGGKVCLMRRETLFINDTLCNHVCMCVKAFPIKSCCRDTVLC